MIYPSAGSWSVQFTAVNRGESPAKIVFFEPATSVKAISPIRDISEEPSYGSAYPTGELVNARAAGARRRDEIGEVELSEIYQDDPDQLEEIRIGKKLVFAYQSVKYRDMFTDNIYESRFCYRLDVNRKWILAGPPGYNRYT